MAKELRSGSVRRRKALIIIAGSLLVVAVAGYFIANAVVRRKVAEALSDLPANVTVRYRSLEANLFTGAMKMGGIEAAYQPAGAQGHRLSIDALTIRGFSVLDWWRSRHLRVRLVRAEGVTINVDDALAERDSVFAGMKTPTLNALIDHIDVTGIHVTGMRHQQEEFAITAELRMDSVTADSIGGFQFTASRAHFVPPGMEEAIDLRQLEADSRQRQLRIDSVQIRPNLDEEAIGRLEGHQVDVVKASMVGIAADGIDLPDLLRHQLHAGEISFHGGSVRIFRDRRLPLKPGDKLMPMDGLEKLPVDLRVGKLHLGRTRFEYVEFPKAGDKTGILVIRDFEGTMEPLINKPRSGDPAYITVTTEGSLMGSGLVRATTRMPFHSNANYEVDGAFHDLDVTRLNNPAENLGQLHLESGMLNSLEFHFDMGPDRSTGKIIGEYHNLVVDKLKEKGGQLKTDKFKSLALKKLIIPRNKDKSLAVSKRTGKVKYKRDKQRYFSYYLLHSLLVGVKSSFTLGFLLPG